MVFPITNPSHLALGFCCAASSPGLCSRSGGDLIDGSTRLFGRCSDEQVAAMGSQGDCEYAALVGAVDATLALVVALELDRDRRSGTRCSSLADRARRHNSSAERGRLDPRPAYDGLAERLRRQPLFGADPGDQEAA